MALKNLAKNFAKRNSVFAKRFLPELNKASRKGILPKVLPGDHIPRIIHQTYPTAELPEALAQNVARMKAMNPGWEHRLHTDADIAVFIQQEYGQRVYRYYLKINAKFGAARADLFRYLLIYKLGGVYLDIKSSLEKPLDETLRPNDVFLLSQWNFKPGEQFYGIAGHHVELDAIPGGEFQQWHVVAAPGHPFLREVIERVLANIDIYNPQIHGVSKKGVLRLTGPIAYTLGIYPMLALHAHRFADARNELGFNYSIYQSQLFTGHKSLFKFHYSDVVEPLIIGSEKKFLAGMLKIMKRMLGGARAGVAH